MSHLNKMIDNCNWLQIVDDMLQLMNAESQNLFMMFVFNAVYILGKTFWFDEQMLTVVTYWWTFKIWTPVIIVFS